jgi:hypothetical protein
MRGFHVIFSKNRWVTRSALLWSELIGLPTASIDAEQSYRRGLISVVASLLAAGCPLAIWGQTLAMNRAFELYDRLRLAFIGKAGLRWTTNTLRQTEGPDAAPGLLLLRTRPPITVRPLELELLPSPFQCMRGPSCPTAGPLER